jgi:hypothetical protein
MDPIKRSYIGRLPRRSRCSKDFFNSHVLQLPSHALTVDRIAVAHEISWRGIPGKSLNQLLRHPFCGWMSGDIEVDHSTPVVSEDQEDIENMERDGRDREEVNRNKFFAVIFEKRAPGLRRWLWIPDHVLGDGRLRELDSEFEDFSMNPRSSPKRIGFAHAADQLADVLGNRRSPGSPVPAFPGPKESETFAMPGDDCFRFHEDKSGAPVGPDVRQPRPEKSVRGSKSRTVRNGASEDVDLVTEGNYLDLESGPGFHDRAERAEQSQENVGHAIFGTSRSVSEGQS